MTYVYDIFLNFNKQLYEFFEWNKEDKIIHAKKINLIKVDSKDYNILLDNQVKIDDNFLLSIFNKCEYFENKMVKTISYAILVTDSYRVMGLCFDMNGNITKYSSLLLDEEEDVLDISDRLKTIYLKYRIIGKNDKNNNLTRYENHIIKYISDDLEHSYKDKNISKLKYLYYEYFNRQCDNLDKIMNDFNNELYNMNDKLVKLYNLIKLSLSQKNV